MGEMRRGTFMTVRLSSDLGFGAPNAGHEPGGKYRDSLPRASIGGCRPDGGSDGSGPFRWLQRGTAARRLVACFAFVLLSMLGFSQESGESANRACELCETPFHKVHVAPETFIRGAYAAPVPALDGYYPAKLSKDPMVLDIVVDSTGVPCSVKVNKNGDAKVLSKLNISLKSWRFKTPKYEGKDICLSSQLLVYARQSDGKPVLFIPGVSDRAKP